VVFRIKVFCFAADTRLSKADDPNCLSLAHRRHVSFEKLFFSIRYACWLGVVSCRYQWRAPDQVARMVGASATPQAWNTLPVAPLFGVRITKLLLWIRSSISWNWSRPRSTAAHSRCHWRFCSRPSRIWCRKRFRAGKCRLGLLLGFSATAFVAFNRFFGHANCVDGAIVPVSDADPSLLHGPCITNLARVHLATCILRLG